jgi:hypothetical protein
MSKMIKITVKDATETSDFEHLPEDWDDMTETDQETYLDTCASDLRDQCVECSAEVVEMEDE